MAFALFGSNWHMNIFNKGKWYKDIFKCKTPQCGLIFCDEHVNVNKWMEYTCPHTLMAFIQCLGQLNPSRQWNLKTVYPLSCWKPAQCLQCKTVETFNSNVTVSLTPAHKAGLKK